MKTPYRPCVKAAHLRQKRRDSCMSLIENGISAGEEIRRGEASMCQSVKVRDFYKDKTPYREIPVDQATVARGRCTQLKNQKY